MHDIYVAEAWFWSIYKEHLGLITENVKVGGVDAALIERLLAQAGAARAARLAARERALAEAREARNVDGSSAEFVRGRRTSDVVV